AAGGDVAGRVVGTDGAAVEGAVVALDDLELPQSELVLHQNRSLDVQGRPRARTDASGAFVFAGAPTGFVRLAAWREGFRIAFSAPLEVRAGETSGEVELVLEPRDRTGSLAGLVLDAAGAPAASAIVEYRYHARGSSGSGGVVAADDGRFEIEG